MRYGAVLKAALQLPGAVSLPAVALAAFGGLPWESTSWLTADNPRREPIISPAACTCRPSSDMGRKIFRANPLSDGRRCAGRPMAERLGGYSGRKVGIAWRGSPKYPADRMRSIPLAEFAPLASVPGVQLFSLQKGPGSEELDSLATTLKIVDLGRHLDETTGAFVETAAVLKNLDLLVACDTAVIHVAGRSTCPCGWPLAMYPTGGECSAAMTRRPIPGCACFGRRDLATGRAFFSGWPTSSGGIESGYATFRGALVSFDVGPTVCTDVPGGNRAIPASIA